MKLRMTRHAERQLTTIRGYIAKDSPRAADRVVAAIRSAADLLTTQPEMGRAVAGSRSREWPVTRLPYILVYRVDSLRQELVILADFHGAQDR